jgi:protein AFG1
MPDYRKIPRALSHVYYHPLTLEHRLEMTKLFRSLSSASGTEVIKGRKLPLWGRELEVPESSEDVARFSFADLCDRPLSAADYLEVTAQFGTVFVEDIPKMGLSEKDQASSAL